MNPIERKNKMLLIVLISLTLLATIFLGRINPLYFIFPAVNFLLIMFRNKSAKQKVLLFCIYLLYGFIVILIIEFVVLSYILKEPPNNLDSFLFSSFFLFFAFIPLKIIERHIGKVKTIALKQKEYYDIPDKFPDFPNRSSDLICDMHFTRIVEKSLFGHKIVHCRTSKKCFSLGRIIHARLLIGVIGDYKRSRKFDDEYSTMIWNNETKTIIDGDYDVIEIQEGSEIEDYNSVVNKIITFLYNQIKRYKPVKEITIRVEGNPPISESTKRLLEERFLKIEYLELNYKKLNYTL